MTATCHTRGHLAYTDAIAAEIERFVEIARGMDPETRVPTCPDWSLRELVEHIGGVHRWATQLVATLSPERIRGRDIALELPPDPSGLGDWLARGGERLLATFRAADPEAAMWSWGADKRARFWPRRMLHETSIHRADAEGAVGSSATFDPAFAVDGIDEFLDNLAHAAYCAPNVEELRGTGERIRWRARDADVAWTIVLEPDRFTWSHGGSEADAGASGSARDLYLFAWGRVTTDALEVTGDHELVARWVKASAI